MEWQKREPDFAFIGEIDPFLLETFSNIQDFVSTRPSASLSEARKFIELSLGHLARRHGTAPQANREPLFRFINRLRDEARCLPPQVADWAHAIRDKANRRGSHVQDRPPTAMEAERKFELAKRFALWLGEQLAVRPFPSNLCQKGSDTHSNASASPQTSAPPVEFVIQLTGPTGFQRVYYGPTILYRNNFRGLVSSDEYRRIERILLSFEQSSGVISLTALSEICPFLLNEQQLLVSKPRPLAVGATPSPLLTRCSAFQFNSPPPNKGDWRMGRQPLQQPRAQKPKTQADIVFCVDVTASMEPCIEGVKSGLQEFLTGLQSAAAVDYRLRLIGYRDLHDPSCTVPWDVFDFTPSVDQFRANLGTIRAHCNQVSRGAESALDALYVAIHSEWRSHKTHKTVVLMTDDNTHPTLHQKTYSRPDNTVSRVIQDFQELRHAMLFLVAPKYPIYSQLERSMVAADRKVIANWVPQDDDRYRGLNSVQWAPLMSMLGHVVSATSIVASELQQ